MAGARVLVGGSMTPVWKGALAEEGPRKENGIAFPF